MFCEHPACSLGANTICKLHCHLSVCEQHGIEHEKRLLNEIERRLDDLSNPLSTLLYETQGELKKSEESRQYELNRINSFFDSHLFSIDERLKLTKTANELILIKRQQLIKYKSGDIQLTRDEYQHVNDLSDQIKHNLHQQYELNNKIRNNDLNINAWPINKENPTSKHIECIVISDSDDEPSQNSTDVIHRMENETINNSSASYVNENPSYEVNRKRKADIWSLRDFCPLTQAGAFGLNSSFLLPNLCSSNRNKRRYLYIHFTRTHRIEPSMAYKLLKAIHDKCNPMETIIFPEDNTKAFIKNIQCPFDSITIESFNLNFIPNTPCRVSTTRYCFKNHLRTIHSITKENSKLIYNAMKDYGHINNIPFEKDICETK